MSSVYDQLFEVRYDVEERRLVFKGADGRTWRPVPVEDTLTLFDEDGNPVSVRLVNGEYALVSADERTHVGLERVELLLVRILAALERVQPEDVDPDPRE